MSLDRLNTFLAEGDRASMSSNWLEGGATHHRMPQPTRRRPASAKVKKPVRNVSYRYTPKQALEAGFLWATFGPKGNFVCAHRSEETGLAYIRSSGLRKAGCVVRQLRETV